MPAYNQGKERGTKMKYEFYPSGVCSNKIDIELDGNVIKDVLFHGGCNGNLKAISALVKGKTVDEIAPILEGITCGFKKTSCSDQLVKGLKEALEAQK